MLGIGQTRPLQGALLAAAQWINAQRTRVVAIDVPSGLEADRGCWLGGVEGVYASETITFIADKPGLHTGDGVDAAGTVTLDRTRRRTGFDAHDVDRPVRFFADRRRRAGATRTKAATATH